MTELDPRTVLHKIQAGVVQKQNTSFVKRRRRGGTGHQLHSGDVSVGSRQRFVKSPAAGSTPAAGANLVPLGYQMPGEFLPRKARCDSGRGFGPVDYE